MEAVLALPRRASTRQRPRARARRYACLQPFAGDERRATARRSARRQRAVPAAGRRAARRAAPQRRRRTCARDGLRRRGRALLRRAERARGRQRRGVLPHDVRRPGRLLEPARPPHGRHARPAARAPRPRHGGTTRVVVWEHNSHVGDARATEMARARRAQRRPAGARAPRPATPSSSASRPTRAPSPPPPTGARRRAHARPARARRAATRRCSTTTGIPAFLLCPLAGGAQRPGAARAAARARDRRDLPARRPSAQSHYFTASLARPVRRARPLRRDARRRAARAHAGTGSAASRPRPTRPRSEPRFTSPHRRRRIPRHGSRPQGGVGSAAHHRRRNPSWFPRVRDMTVAFSG